MKIGFLGLDLPLGKHRFNDVNLALLEKKFSPKKTTPFFVEFVGEDLVHSDIILCSPAKKLDLIIEDLGKVEQRLAKELPENEKSLLTALQDNLEKERFVSDSEISSEAEDILKPLGFLTAKPVVLADSADDIGGLIEKSLQAGGMIFFYTAGPKEVKGWLLKKGSNIVEAAGKIHSDLARGFIRADVVNIKELDNFHNINDARQKGLVKTVGKDYIVEYGDIIEVKFSV